MQRLHKYSKYLYLKKMLYFCTLILSGKINANGKRIKSASLINAWFKESKYNNCAKKLKGPKRTFLYLIRNLSKL